MTHSEKVLMEQMLPLSNNKEWELAKKEWRLQNISKVEKSTCLCGQYPIIERCHITNKITGNTVIVGNCCVKKFIDNKLGTDSVFKSIQKVQTQESQTFTFPVIRMAYTNKWINEWEYNFYCDVRRKRKFTIKQIAIVNRINSRILNHQKEKSIEKYIKD